MSIGSDLRWYPGESFSHVAAFFCFRRRHRKNANPARAMTARGTATAGAIIEALEVDLAGAGLLDGEDVDAGAATTLGFEVVRVLEPPPDLVTTDVIRTMLVDDCEVS